MARAQQNTVPSTEPGSQPVMDLPDEEAPRTLEERKVAALEEIAMCLRNVDVRAALARVATTKPDAGDASGISVTVPLGAGIKRCPRGHGMQATDKYCQHCWRADHRKRGARDGGIVVPAAPAPKAAADDVEVG
jgi:hypothetical protein